MTQLTAETRGTQPARGIRGVRIPRQRTTARPQVAPRAPSALRLLPAVALGSDVLWLCLAVGLASAASGSAPTLAVAAPAMVIGWVLSIAGCGGYARGVLGTGTEEYVRAFNATFVAAALVGITCYLTRFELSREFFVLACVAGSALVLLGRVLMRSALTSSRRRGNLLHRVLLVGDQVHTREVAEVLGRDPGLGYGVVGALHGQGAGSHSPLDGRTLHGQARRVAAAARAQHADVVFLTGGAFDSANEMRRLAWELEHEDVQVVIAPSVTDVSRERIRVRPVGGLPLIHVDKPRAEGAVRRAKRSFDVVAAVGLLLVFAPVFAFAALRIKRADGGPVLFRQTRVGRDGSKFQMLKFRTMVTNAEQLLADLHEQQGYQDGLFKMAHDPRVTRPGRWLRRFSLDELPQLLNVVRGDMSLVGPRPPLVHEVAQYDDDMSRRLRVRPGMTGLWQVSGRSDLSFAEAIRLDLYYVDNWSMVQDLTILTKTFGAVFGSRGAY